MQQVTSFKYQRDVHVFLENQRFKIEMVHYFFFFLKVWCQDATLLVYFSYLITYVHSFIQSHSYNTTIHRHSLIMPTTAFRQYFLGSGRIFGEVTGSKYIFIWIRWIWSSVLKLTMPGARYQTTIAVVLGKCDEFIALFF
jgi:hypothetical protein